ncbi:hypothetical protein SCHPADRAFT_818271 [Schizopora paradoxa]|uniref:DUF7729 domain-containing protein n=1 Tax=Schizopora paradoxa TaxID=27342 RepID=A0A0H2S5Z8_9AGAM|nr:hypothetical protein SCHPADRAFT_818271 [Schizopora paradoxa]
MDGKDFLKSDFGLEAESGRSIDTTVRFAVAHTELELQRKRAIGRRIRWIVVLVPAFFVLVALSTHFASSCTHFSTPSVFANLETWQHHDNASSVAIRKRSPSPQSQGLTLSNTVSTTGSSLSTNPSGTSNSPTSTSSVPQTSQTIPPAPAASNPPVLPTPFPQPFDSVGATTNLSTSSCQAFFQNMTQADDFRKCRPLSLLLQFGSAFIEAQTNLTALSNIIFGTCNTVNSFDSCTQSLASYASQLSTSCSKEVQQSNSLVLTTREGLLNYPILRNAGCLQDQAGSQGFCYVEAVHQSNPADTYLYQLPFGVPLPQAAKPTCSPCGGSVLSSYASALQNSSGNGNGSTDGLKATYDAAASASASACGSGYAQVGIVSGAEGRWQVPLTLSMASAVALSLFMALW